MFPVGLLRPKLAPWEQAGLCVVEGPGANDVLVPVTSCGTLVGPFCRLMCCVLMCVCAGAWALCDWVVEKGAYLWLCWLTL